MDHNPKKIPVLSTLAMAYVVLKHKMEKTMSLDPDEQTQMKRCKHGVPQNSECLLCKREEYIDRYSRFTHDEDVDDEEDDT